MKLFDIIKKIFNIEKIDDLNDDLIDAYYNELEKPETTENVEEDEVVEEETVVENAEPVVEEKETEEVVEEKETEEVVENTEPVVEEEKIVEEKDEEKDVLTRDVINNSKGNMPIDRSTLMTLHGKEFFNALYKNKKNLI